MDKKPLDPQEGVEIVTERMKYRGIRIRYHHDSWVGKLIGWFAYACFGKKFPTPTDPGDGWVIVQTVGNTIWLPANWDATDARIRFEILLHEERHTFQFEEWGLGSRTFGILTMGSLYVACLPIFWTMRAKFEREAYRKSMVARFLLGDPPGEGFMKHCIKNFCTRNYVWMMAPWHEAKFEKWYWRTLLLAQEEARSGQP